jgi:hypothetical protein
MKMNSKQKKQNKPCLKTLRLTAPLVAITGTLLAPVLTHAAIPGTLGGTAYLTYDQAAWATMVESYIPLDINGKPVGTTPVATENTFGKRFYYPQKFIGSEFSPSTVRNSVAASDFRIANGTADPIAVEQWRIFDPAQRIPLPQPIGGFAMTVDPLTPGIDPSWGTGYTQSYSYDPNDENTFPFHLSDGKHPVGDAYDFISLGGTFRLASDLVSPGGSLWWSNMTIEGQDNPITEIVGAEKWYIGSRGTFQASHTTFELVNPLFGVDPVTGLTTLEADYKWGDSSLSRFFGLYGSDSSYDENGNEIFDVNGRPIPDLNPSGQKILGHISLNPAAVPLPASVWLFGSAVIGFLRLRAKKA